MPAADQLSKLIDEVYDAGLDPAFWPRALESISRFIDGTAIGIVTKNTASLAGTPNHIAGFDPYYVRMYAETHAMLDPFATLPYFAIEEVVSVPQLLPYDEFCRGRFFHEWLRPQGSADAASCLLEKSATGFSLFSVLRRASRGPVDDEMLRRTRCIVPHVRRAVLVSKTIAGKAAEAATLAATLDGLSAGVILVDASGRIVHANATAHGILSAGDAVRSVGGRLAAISRQSEQELSAAIAEAACRHETMGRNGIAVPLEARDGARYIAHVLPMVSGARRDGSFTTSAAAAVFVRKAEFAGPSAPEIIARQFGLTPTELRVLLAVVEIGGVSETAESLGIGEATVKTHLHRLFHKTGATRQADLVKLVAGFSSPLVN